LVEKPLQPLSSRQRAVKQATAIAVFNPDLFLLIEF